MNVKYVWSHEAVLQLFTVYYYYIMLKLIYTAHMRVI